MAWKAKHRLTLKEIGRRLGVTREWVRKIEVRAVRKLDYESESDSSAGRPGSARLRPNSRRTAGRSCRRHPSECRGRDETQATSIVCLV